MASVSASHLIIFVASLVIAAGVVGTLTTGVERVSSSIDDGSLDVSQQIRMDMTILNDPGVEESNDENLEIHVRNTGSQPVPGDPSSFDIVLNGDLIILEDDNIEIRNNGGNVWRPGEVVTITIQSSDTDLQDDNRLFLTVFGDEELFEFRGS